MASKNELKPSSVYLTINEKTEECFVKKLNDLSKEYLDIQIEYIQFEYRKYMAVIKAFSLTKGD